jgi:hypothetical protein
MPTWSIRWIVKCSMVRDDGSGGGGSLERPAFTATPPPPAALHAPRPQLVLGLAGATLLPAGAERQVAGLSLVRGAIG